MDDYIVRATAADGQIRAFAATTRQLTEKARQIHETSPVVTAAFGRLLTAGVMMGTMMKGEQDMLTVKIDGSGALGHLLVTADSRGHVKGYVSEPVVLLPPNDRGKLDVGGAIGPGMLSVIRDMGLKEPYVGQTALQTSEIAEDLTYYFATSEQIPSAVGLGVLMERNNTVRQAGGFIIQVMPFIEEEVLSALEQNVQNIPAVTELLDRGLTPEELLGELLGPLGLSINDTVGAAYDCNCSRERVGRALISLGREQLSDMIDEGEEIEMNCHFCGRKYQFTIQDLKALYRKAR